MNKTIVLWLLIAAILGVRSFVRPSYAVGLYMLTFYLAPRFWWWGDLIEDYRWNFFAGILLLVTIVATNSRHDITYEHPFRSNAVKFLAFMALNCIFVHFALAANATSSAGWLENRLKFILLFFLLQFSIRDEKDYGIVAMAITLGMGYIGYEATINERGSFSGGRLEGIGAAGVQSSNQLASLFITGLPIAATLLFTQISKWSKAVVVASAAMAFNVVLMCNSRGAFLGLLLGGVVFLVMASGPARKLALRLVAITAVGTFLLLGDPEILTRFGTTFTSEGQRDNSAQSRIIFWTAASKMVLDYPLGSGGNSFSEGRGWRYMGRTTVASDTRAIHNGFLTEMVDWGVQGFTLMLLFIGAVFRTLWRGRRLALQAKDSQAITIYACIGAAMTAWMVSSVFGDYLNDEWGFWPAALAYAYLRVHTAAKVHEAPAEAPAVVPELVTPLPPRSYA
jgi:hypothetical protein